MRHSPGPSSRLVSMRFSSAPALLCLLAAAWGCDAQEGDAPRSESDVPEQVVSGVDTLITVESAIIARVSDIAVGPAGSIWIADNMNHRLLVLDAEGEVEMVGREGSGPGEFRSPIALGASSSAIEVYDYGNGRLQRLSPSGEYLESHPVPQTLLGPGGAGMDGEGRLVGETRGRHGVLAIVAGPSAEGDGYRGEARAAMPTEISLPNLQEQAADGQVPREFSNNIVSMLGPEGKLWLLVQSDASLEHYDTDGTLLWTRELAAPEVDAAFQRFFGGWEDVNDWASVPLLWVARWGAFVDGELWLMTDAVGEDGSVVLRLDAESGELTGRLALPIEGRADRFAVDPSRGFLYAAQPEDALLLRFRLP